ncbi:MAG: hypothetical protein CVU09_16670 [Bacteroidetes bacterium HGW-Bacteroidetes-4]|nr:MAG: hypothetical protein CVU09_16670 [Bacteroidetes bacterium HGW-Bacteroidetes-4]
MVRQAFLSGLFYLLSHSFSFYRALWVGFWLVTFTAATVLFEAISQEAFQRLKTILHGCSK